ncbi:MAG: glycosyltransferase family 4 protein [Chloroflexi bacterium]|nr:glycosyltransferase family 4 protein [Chloroflexota bacterium]
MRVLAIAPTGFFADYGCHVRIWGQLRALQRLGCEVRLVTYPAGRDIPDLTIVRAPPPFSRSIPIGSSRRKILLDLFLAPVALAQALRFRPHIVHGYLHEGALMGHIAARLLRAPLTFDYQGSLTAEMLAHRFLTPNSTLLPAWTRLEQWIERQPLAIFPSSAASAARLSDAGIPATRIHLAPDSVDPDMFRPQPPNPALRRRLGLPEKRPLVVYLGLLAPYQGVDLLLEAIAHPLLRDHPAHFLIMGFPFLERYRHLAAKLGVAHRVHFTGAIPYIEAPRHLALGQVAVAPKLLTSEGSGKLLPYMSMALPVVATDTPVHREYLAEDAVLTPISAEGLASGLFEALNHRPYWAERAKRLRQRVLQQYTWRHVAQVMDAAFRSLAGARL